MLTTLTGGAIPLAGAWLWGAMLLRRQPVPHTIRLAVGGAALSTIVFLVLLANAGSPLLLAGLALAPALLWRWMPRGKLVEPVVEPLGRSERWAALAIFAAYGVWCAVNALAPEVSPDGITYHLGLVNEYVRLGGFPDRIAFYDLVPQGMEMLFAIAFGIGRHSAAKLVEFGFFAATLPLVWTVARRLGLSDRTALVAAAFYFCAPVVGITGASTYNDAGGVFFALAAFYLLLLWRDSGDWRYALVAGVLAGFCYAIKMPGGVAALAGAVFVVTQRRWKALVLFGLGAGLAAAPWVVRALVETGNPVAPLFNQFFPNPWFHLATGRGLARDLASLHGVPWYRVPFELALGGGLSGIYGPLLLAVPFALAGIRRRAVQLCLAAAVLLALGWFGNVSARFVMMAIVPAGLALGAALEPFGKRAAWAAIALQAVACFPPVVELWEPFYGFRLHEFPIAAALGIESETDYLLNHVDEYKVARMVESNTPPNARILALLPVATAYTSREVAISWQSAEADWLEDTLRVGGMYGNYPFFDVSATWPARPLRAVRVRVVRTGQPGAEWCVHELRVFSGADAVEPNKRWSMSAEPNAAEARLALDRNLATRWRTWEPMRAGMYVELTLDAPQQLTGAVFQSHTPAVGARFEFVGVTPEGNEVPLAATPVVVQRPPEDLRAAAGLAVGRSGYDYLLAPTGRGGDGPLGDAIDGQEAAWGFTKAGSAGTVRLLKVK